MNKILEFAKENGIYCTFCDIVELKGGEYERNV
jgi:hypothetical protein